MLPADRRRTCSSCGFEDAAKGHACALCGAADDARNTETSPTLTRSERPTVVGQGSAPETTTHAAPEVGEIIADRYRLDSVLGQGGMGRVYLARDLAAQCDVALKLVRPDASEDPGRRSRFRREIEVLGMLDHPAIPRVREAGEHGGQMFYVSDLVRGEDLKAAIARRGAFPPEDAIGVAAEVAKALTSASRKSMKRLAHLIWR